MQDSSTGVSGNVAVEEFEGSNDVECQRAILLPLVGSRHQTGSSEPPRTATRGHLGEEEIVVAGGSDQGRNPSST